MLAARRGADRAIAGGLLVDGDEVRCRSDALLVGRDGRVDVLVVLEPATDGRLEQPELAVEGWLAAGAAPPS